MKKTYIFAMLLAVLALATSCKKEEPGNTAAKDLAGEWMVTVDVVDEDGEVLMEDPYGLGWLLMLTYNTNADSTTQIYLSDIAHFWDFTVKLPCNMEALTFGSTTEVENEAYQPSKVKVWGGKVSPGAAKTPIGGYTADGFECYVTFDDDDYGFIYWIHGYRKSGFAGGEE